LDGDDVVAKEAVALNALVQVHAQQLKHDAQVIAKDKMAAHPHHIAAVLRVL
jgi:hypothetical protein